MTEHAERTPEWHAHFMGSSRGRTWHLTCGTCGWHIEGSSPHEEHGFPPEALTAKNAHRCDEDRSAEA
jgi:hypothetical protein